MSSICAMIPLSFESCNTIKQDKYAAFLSCYEANEKSDDIILYTIKEDLLLDNYKSFVEEFYDIYIEKISYGNEDADLLPVFSVVRDFDMLPTPLSYEKFLDLFRNNQKRPCVWEDGDFWAFTLQVNYLQVWIFRQSWKVSSESYGADVELAVLEALMKERMKNPLAAALRLCLWSG